MSEGRWRAAPRWLRLPGSLRSRLALALSVLLGVIAAFLLVQVPGQLESDALDITSEKAEAIGEVTAYGLVAPVLFDDREAMAAVIAGTRRDDDILYVIVVDTAGTVLAEDGLLLAHAARFAATDEHDPEQVGDVLRVVESIREGDRLVGRVYLGLSLASLQARVAHSRARIAWVIALAFLIALACVYAIGSIVTKPLGRIVSVARGVSNGETRRRVGLPPAGEVGELGHAFDTMLDRLENAYAEVQDMNRGLEARITTRTAQLRSAYDERLSAERAALESERRFRTIFDSAAIAIVLIDLDYTLVEVNPAFADMMRAPRTALVGRPMSELGEPAGEDATRAWAELDEVRRGQREHVACEVLCRPHEGSVVWGYATVSSVRDELGSVRYLIAMVENITSRKQLEEQLRQSQKLEAIGRLAGGIAHDFNNLLTTINGVSDVILADLDGAERLRPDIEEIAKAGDRAASLTRQLLAFSRQQMLQPRVIDVNAAIEDLAAMLLRTIGEDVQLLLRLDPALPRVKADPGQLTQVIMNLAVNARDAMPHGGRITIETAATEVDAALAARFDTIAGPAVRISVADEGQGIDALTMAHIFEPFFTTKEVGKGTGLGLATVYGIVKQSGGGIDVESHAGRGTTFTILLPATQAVDRAPLDTGRAHQAIGSETVLLVEDEQSVRALASRVLRKSGYTVIEHASPEEALRAVESDGIHLDAVLTDVVMPGRSGPEMVRELTRRRPHLKVLYMSGYPRDQIGHLDASGGQFAFVQKPMSPGELADAVRTLLDGVAPAAA